MHPGWVQTRLGGPSAPTPEQAAEGIYRGIRTRSESGRLWNVEADAVEAY
ncbi:hypothetical protein [Hymenobacter sp. CRA2]|nr:hypothetical protein [Hymenobacter sp. CRA2]